MPPEKNGYVIKIISYGNESKFFTNLDNEQIFVTGKKESAYVFAERDKANIVLEKLRKIKSKFVIINVLPLHEEK